MKRSLMRSAPQLLIALTLIVGCGSGKKPWEVVYPTTGVVTLDGSPIAGARITFIPQDKEFPSTVRPTASTKEDGSFEVGTYGSTDGAPAGEYKVIVVRFPAIVTESSATNGPNNLPKKYSRQDSTDLEIKVQPTNTQLALELKK